VNERKKVKSIAICIAIQSKKKILQYRQQYQITKCIGNMEAILKKVLPIILQYFQYCNINNPG